MHHIMKMCGAVPFIVAFLIITSLVAPTTFTANVGVYSINSYTQSTSKESAFYKASVINGDWNITSPTIFADGEVVVNGRLFVKNGGSLTLRNATVYINSTQNDVFWIEVLSGGSLILDNATVTAYNSNYRYYVKVDNGSKFVMDNSSKIIWAGVQTHEEEKRGVWINTDNATISDSEITDCYLIYFYNVTNLTLTDSKIHSCSEIKISKSKNILLNNNTIDWSSDGITIQGSYNLTIRNNIISNTTYYGMNLDNVNTTVIEFNRFAGCSKGVYIINSEEILIRNNTFVENTYASWLSNVENITVQNNELNENAYGIYSSQGFNITIIGNNITASSYYGISISESNNVTIKGNIINGNVTCEHGIEMTSSVNNSITENTIRDCYIGIYIIGVGNSSISANILLKNPIIVLANTKNDIYGLQISDDNTLNDHPIRYYYDLQNAKLTGGTIGELLYLYCENISVTNVVVHTLFIGYSTNVSTNYIFAENSTYGLYVTSSHYITLANSHIKKNVFGIYVIDTDHMVIDACEIKENSYGLRSYELSYTIIRHNVVSENDIGFYATYSSDSIVVANIFLSNQRSFKLDSHCDNITFYLNDFVFDEIEPIDDGANRFDNGTIGNYWMQYTGIDADNDGIGDTPYYIDSDSVDHYPLMKPYRFEDTIAPVIHSVTHTPEQPTSAESVTVYANVTDNLRVKRVILSYYNGSGWINVTMNYNEIIGLYVGTIPALPSNTTVKYKIYAEDYYGNWIVSDTYSYTVLAEEAPPGLQLPILEIVIFVGIAAVIVIIVAIMKLRKKKK